MTYSSPTWVDVPAGSQPPGGAPALDASNLQALTDEVASMSAARATAVTSVAGRTGAVSLTKTDVGLANVDNTSDVNKPISTATSTALAAKAPLASPALTGTPTINGVPISASGTTSTTPYRAAKAFTTQIPASPTLDTNSATLVTALSAGGVNRVLNIGAYGVPIYTADSSTPRYAVNKSAHQLKIDKLGSGFSFGTNSIVQAGWPMNPGNGYCYVATCTGKTAGSAPTFTTGFGDVIVDGTVIWLCVGANSGGFGDNDLAHIDVPIPDGALPATGTDGHLVVIDPTTDSVYSLWQAVDLGGSPHVWKCSWGGVYPLSGDGSSPHANYTNTQYPFPISTSTASGVAVNCGCILASEINAQSIQHALIFSTDISQATNYRYPATATDGSGAVDGSHIVQGARIQLDPTINLASISGITAVEIAVGTALQTYGAYCVDTGGSRMAFECETPNTTAKQSIYTANGLTGDYYALSHIPWSSLRVLAHWDGS